MRLQAKVTRCSLHCSLRCSPCRHHHDHHFPFKLLLIFLTALFLPIPELPTHSFCHLNFNFITIFLFKLTKTSQRYINFSSPLQVSTYWSILNSKHTKITTFNITENSAYTSCLWFSREKKGRSLI